MPRLARQDLLYAGCYAHVISRSIRKLKIFRMSEDFQKFYGLLKRTKREAGFKIHHYCVMQTHFHLVVSVGDVLEFSRAMQFVKSQYSFHFHREYKLSGPIWRERFRALLIEDERYMLACGKYIENNPVEAGLVKNPEEWKNSSYHFYHKNKKDDLIDVAAGHAHIRDVQIEDDEAFESGKVIGSDFFKFRLRQKLGIR